MFKFQVLSCREIKGTSDKGPYQFYIANCVVTGADNQAVAGDFTMDKPVAAGKYTATSKLETYKGKIALSFGSLVASA